MKSFMRIVLAALLAAGLAAPSFADSQTPAFSIMVGRGIGNIGYDNIAAASGGKVLLGQSTSSKPAFVTMAGDATIDSSGNLTLDGEIHCIAALTSAADKVVYYTGSNTCSLMDVTSTARSLLDDTSVSAMRSTLGVVIGTNVQAWDADLDIWATVTPSANGKSLVSAADYAAMRALLDLEPGTDFYSKSAADAAFQPLAGGLTDIAGLSPSNDDFLQRKAGHWANRTVAQVMSDLGISGTNTGDQTITLTGDVTGSGTGSFATTIANSAVSLAKMANMATASVIYRKTAGTGAPEVNSLATLKTDLGLSGTNTGDQTTVSGNAGTATALQTARAIDGQSFDGTADITVIAPGTHAATGKTTPVDADEVPLVDSAASNVLKKVTWANVKATLKTYFDTLYRSASTAIALTALANQAADTVVLNASGSSAAPTAVAMPTSGTNGCAGAANALTYNTTTHALGCNSISGTGDVVGPSSVTDANPTVFDGATGKLIKEITYSAFKTALSLVKGDVGLGSVTNDAQLKAADLDTDGTLTANSDTKIASQKATKSYVAAAIAALSSVYQALDSDLTTWAGITPGSGVSAALTTGFSSAVQSILDDSSIAAIKTTLSLSASDVGLGNVTNNAQVKKAASSTNGAIPTWSGTSGDALNTGGLTAPSGAIVGTTDTQTLTNKTLTNAVVGTQSAGDNSTKAASTAYVDATTGTLGTVWASTSGTSHDWTGIPAGVTQITVMFSGVSTSSTSPPLIQIGDSGGIETSGYLGTTGHISGSAAASSFTSGFSVDTATIGAANTFHGALILSLLDASTNTWAASGAFSHSDDAVSSVVSGAKSTSGVLDRVRVTTVSGSPTFDAGKVNVSWHF